MEPETNPATVNTAAPVAPQAPEMPSAPQAPKQDLGVKVVETKDLPRDLVNCVKNYSGRMLKIQYESKNVSPEFKALIKDEMILRGMIEADAQ